MLRHHNRVRATIMAGFRVLILNICVCAFLVAHVRGARAADSDRPATSRPTKQRFGPGHFQPGTFSRTLEGPVAKLSYGWQNNNTTTTPGPDANSVSNSFTYELTIKLSRLNQAVASFGILESSMTLPITYRTDQEKMSKLRARSQEWTARGFLAHLTGGKIGPDYKWMINQSRADVYPVTLQLCQLARAQGYKTTRDIVGVLASFVQSMEYKVPPSTRTDDAGQQIFTGGINMPIETLYNGWGDCDTKSILLASMLANLARERAILLMGKSHVFIGFKDVPHEGDRTLVIQNETYILIEATHTWPIGKLPEEEWAGLNKGQYSVIPLF